MFLCDFSEAKNCLVDKHIAFIGDSRIRQLFYSFVKIINPQFKEEGNKVKFVYSLYQGFVLEVDQLSSFRRNAHLHINSKNYKSFPLLVGSVEGKKG